MRCVRPDFTTLRELALLPAQRLRRAARSAGSSSSAIAERGREVHRRREHVVRRLRRVHLIVRVHRLAERARTRGARSPRSRSCSTTFPNRSGTRRSGSASSYVAAGDLVGRGRDRVADRLRHLRHVAQPAFTRAASALISASARTSARSIGSPEIGKFSTARWVCAPQCASAGTRTSPIESCSTR